MGRFTRRMSCLLLLLLLSLLCQSLDLCASLNDEGRALLRFRERVAVDPYGALSNWIEGADDPCSWFGVECSDDGRVVALVLRCNRYIGNAQTKLHELSMISELLVDDEQSFLRFVVSRKTENVPIRRLLKGRPRVHQNHNSGAPASAPSPSPSPMAPPPPFRSNSPPSTKFVPPAPSPSPNNRASPGHPHSKYVPSVQVNPPPGKHNSHLIVFLSVTAGSCFLLALSLVYLLCCRANKVVTVMPWRTGLSGQLQKAFVTGVPSLRRVELEAACEDFSNVVGSLSDCFLYKGTLSSGVEIAVTSSMVSSAKDWSEQDESQFRNKISVLSKVTHKNFMNLIGFCEEEEPFSRMMVYEYAPNGTLFEHLHIKETDHLDWAARLRIIMGVAYCLEHLHQLNPPAILKNLNSASIYLCDDYAAKISDLSFWNEEKETELSSEKSGVLDVQLSTQEGNVYKFGIILLEIISGRLPFSEDDGLLVLWASSHLTGKRPLMDMVDTTLELFSEENVTALCEVIKSCINPDPKKRPTMSEVVSQLGQITAMTPDAASPKLSPLWWAELEIISAESNSLH